MKLERNFESVYFHYDSVLVVFHFKCNYKPSLDINAKRFQIFFKRIMLLSSVTAIAKSIRQEQSNLLNICENLSVNNL
jgi:hypothetical protein